MNLQSLRVPRQWQLLNGVLQIHAAGCCSLLLIGGERTRWQHVMWPVMSVGLSRAGWHSTSLGCTEAKLMPRVQPRVSNGSQTVSLCTCCDCWDKCFSSLQHFRLWAFLFFFFLRIQGCLSQLEPSHYTLKEIAVATTNSLQERLVTILCDLTDWHRAIKVGVGSADTCSCPDPASSLYPYSLK